MNQIATNARHEIPQKGKLTWFTTREQQLIDRKFNLKDESRVERLGIESL